MTTPPIAPRLALDDVRSHCLRTAWFVVLPIAIGAIVYLLFRSPQLLVFRWIDALGLLDETMVIRHYLDFMRLPDAFLYSLPDGLWVYAVTNSMLLIWGGRPPAYWLFAGLSLAVGGEVGQALSFVPGTYEHLDIIAYFLGFSLALFQLGLTNEHACSFRRGAARVDRLCFRQRRHK